MLDGARDIMTDFNRYPEVIERVSCFQYEDYHKLREMNYDMFGSVIGQDW